VFLFPTIYASPIRSFRRLTPSIDPASPRDPCDNFCTPIADVDPVDPNSHICTNSVILQFAQCDDCEGSLSLLSNTDNYGELQDDVDSFVDSCNIAGFKVKNVTVKGSSDLPPGSQSADSAAATHAEEAPGHSRL
ncbi:hypothetical protein GGX14DRAFT_697592, partial [Mycena pura]